jgi:hypothetical protein
VAKVVGLSCLELTHSPPELRSRLTSIIQVEVIDDN